jgi:hypothetical protein
MNICNPHIINLHEELSYMLMSSAHVITGKLEEVRHSKPPRVRDGIKIIQVWFLVGPFMTLRGKP